MYQVALTEDRQGKQAQGKDGSSKGRVAAIVALR